MRRLGGALHGRKLAQSSVGWASRGGMGILPVLNRQAVPRGAGQTGPRIGVRGDE